MKKEKQNKKTIIIGVIILIFVIIFLIMNNFKINNKQTENLNSIKIGVVGPFNDNDNRYGLVAEQGVEFGVDYINSNGGINGHPIELVKKDGKCNPLDAVDAINKLVNVDNIRFIVGGICSGETLAMIPITQAAKAILFSPLSTSYKISKAGDYVFRNIISDKYTAEQLAVLIKDKDNSMSILSENSDYARDFSKVLSEKYKILGGKIIDQELYNNNTRDWKTLISNILKSNPEAIYISYQSFSPLLSIVKELRKANYTGNIYTSELENYRLVQNPNIFDGIIVANTTQPDNNNEVYKRLVVEYKAKYNIDIDYPENFANGYDAIMILANAISNVGENTDKVNDYIHNLKDYKGLTGTYSFDKNGDVIGLKPVYRKVIDNKLINIQ